MSIDVISQINSDSSERTEQIGAAMGSGLRGGEVIVLTSDLGGGKTTFVRGMARGMGSRDHVSSPTFTLSREYASVKKNLTLHHFDFYRLSEPGIMSLELSEILADPTVVVVIEWADVVESVLPENKIVISLTRQGEDSRKITLNYPKHLAYLTKGIE